jgi:Zn-dependent protease with chaperone function
MVLATGPAAPRGGSAEFGAPVGGKLRWSTRLMVVLVVAMAIGDGWLVFSGLVPGPARWFLLASPALVGGVLYSVWWYSRILGYRLEAGELVVLRPNREKRIALAGLVAAEADPQAMDWSIKVWGNDGLGAVTGRFRNRRLGPYEALVTDRERAVVLRWPERCLVVSPDRPDDFVRQLRHGAGLPR